MTRERDLMIVIKDRTNRKNKRNKKWSRRILVKLHLRMSFKKFKLALLMISNRK